MTTYVCPVCEHRHTPSDPDVVGVSHPCGTAGVLRRMIPAGRSTIELYCGNFECPTRAELVLHHVPLTDIVDGERWVCRSCRPRVVDVAPL